MKCERCQKNEASIHIAQVINGTKTEHHLCQACAAQSGYDFSFKDMVNPFLSSGMFGGSIFNTTGGIPAFGGTAPRDVVCPECGTTFEEFRKSGLLGCSRCYEAFRERLDPVLRRVQGGTRHIGRTVCRTEENQEQLMLKNKLTVLRKELAAAVEREAYEEAARIRDEIRGLESRLCDNADNADQTDKTGKADKTNKTDKTDKTNKTDKSDKSGEQGRKGEAG